MFGLQVLIVKQSLVKSKNLVSDFHFQNKDLANFFN